MAKKTKPDGWRNRIIGHGEEAPDQLLANPANWRVHPKAQQDALSGVLSQVGWVQDVIVNRQTGHVVDGHLRVSLAISRQEPAIPVVYVDLSPEEEALVLATLDPLSAMAAADKDKLDTLLREVASSDAAVMGMLSELAKDAGLDYMQEAKEAPEAQVDRAAELQEKWQTARGQLWQIPSQSVPGKAHRLLCGDSTSAEDVARLMDGEKADAVFTDPPYGMGLDADYTHMPETRIASRAYESIQGDDKPFDAAPYIQRFDGVKEQFWWGGDYYYQTLPSGGSWLVWDKRNENSDGLVGNHFEMCWSRVRHRRRMVRHHWSGVNARNPGLARSHPTEKPIAVLIDIISEHILPAAVIADWFQGSGTTMVAAEQTGRLCYGMEIEPKYVAVSLERLSQMGLQPMLTDGR